MTDSKITKSTDKCQMSSEWPDDGLEFVPDCPVCGSQERILLHEGLLDEIFFCAPGKWNMFLCQSCASAYLDPRPSSETISLAYEEYLTHDEAPPFTSLTLLKKIRRMMTNAYRNHYYGTKSYPASRLSLVFTAFMKDGRAIIDAGMRHLPKIKKNKRLLDFGCGNGLFMLRASSAGWDVTGVDFDPTAVKVAQEKGLDVRLGGLENFDPVTEQFDVITLSHVIEHVFDPIDILRQCYVLLKPGGYVWIDTPNIESEGHHLFGSSWRGLEPPRHLVIFNLKSMSNTLTNVGFSELQIQPYRPVCQDTFSASLAIKNHIDPYSISYKDTPFKMVVKAEKIEKSDPEKREFITIKAWKANE